MVLLYIKLLTDRFQVRILVAELFELVLRPTGRGFEFGGVTPSRHILFSSLDGTTRWLAGPVATRISIPTDYTILV